jgi:hypothetical protein
MAAGSLVGVAGSRSALAAADEKEHEAQYLFVQNARTVSLKAGVLTLKVDAYAFSEIAPLFFDKNEDAWEYSYRAINALDTRNNIGFRYYETGSPFEYELVRLLYLKKRELEIAK